MELCSIIIFNIILLAFTKFLEFLKNSTINGGLTLFLIFQPKDMLMLLLNFKESQAKTNIQNPGVIAHSPIE